MVATARTVHDPPFVAAEFRTLYLLGDAGIWAGMADGRPEAIVHQATALTGLGNNLCRFDHAFTATNRLRTDGPTRLIQAVTSC